MKNLIPALRHPRDYEWRRLRPWQKHSEVLAIGGLIYLGVGLAFIALPVSSDRKVALDELLHYAPMKFWGSFWIAAGLLALLSTRWPPASKTWGYSALSGVAWMWTGAYVVGVIAGAPLSGLIGALIYFLMAYFWYAIAGLANPDDVVVAVQNSLQEPPKRSGG